MGFGKGAFRAWAVRRSWLRWLAAGLVAGGLSLAVVGRPAQAGARGRSALTTGSHLSARPGLHVIPFPGTPDASLRSPVIFSSLSAGDIRSVSVTGSRSGRHHGRLLPLPAGAGTAFVPRRPFAPGERVEVVADLRSRAAGTASGEPGASRLSFSFVVAVPVAPPHASASSQATERHDRPEARPASGSPTRSFRSEPALHPPAVSVSHDPDTRSGDIFLSPGPNKGGGLMILNPRGQLVWFDSAAPLRTFNLAVQSYRGQPVLTWWQGDPAENVIANRAYRTVAVVKAADGYITDVHEFLITPQGTAWLEAVSPVQANLTSVGGSSDGELRDCVIQEVDIRTGQLLWQWNCYGHIPLNASYAPLPTDGTPWDAYHLNSLQVLPNGNLLVSVRFTWSVYEISGQTGRILWTLGGRYNQFRLGPGTQFSWQHDARLIGNTLTVFDDAASGFQQEENQSSAKELWLNVGQKTVTLIHRYEHSPPLLSGGQGSMQILPNGNIFVGWGTEPDFSEYTPSGKQIFNGTFAVGTSSYRAYRFPWTGHPVTPPDLAVAATSNGQAKVWASWNGATNVSAWRLLGGSSPSSLQVLTTHPDHGFQTQITLGSQPAYVEAQALNAQGRVLGTSAAQTMG